MHLLIIFCCSCGAVMCGEGITGYRLKEMWVCGRLYFPTMAPTISPMPCALLQCDLATPPLREGVYFPFLKLGRSCGYLDKKTEQTKPNNSNKTSRSLAMPVPDIALNWLGSFHFCLLQGSAHIRSVAPLILPST